MACIAFVLKGKDPVYVRVESAQDEQQLGIALGKLTFSGLDFYTQQADPRPDMVDPKELLKLLPS